MLHLKLALLVVVATLAVASGATKARLLKRYASQLEALEANMKRYQSSSASSSSSSSNVGNRPYFPESRDFDSSHTFGRDPSQFEVSQVGAALNVSEVVGLRLMGMALVAMSMETPKSLSRLLFNGNESVDLMNRKEMMNLVSKGPRIIGTDEYSCVNRCANDTKPMTTRSNDSMADVCSLMGQLVECAGQCIQQGRIYATFAQKELIKMKELVCTNKPEDLSKKVQGEVDECMQTILNDTVGQFKLFHHSIGCYLKLEEASDNKDTCYVLKSCVIESTIDMLEKICPNAKFIIGFAKPAFVGGLTFLSDGRLVNECPSLYSSSA